MSSLSSSSKNHSRKQNSNRDRDRNKSVASESGGSSQCDTPPLVEKDGAPAQGKFAGVGPDSILCMAEQVGADLNAEAATNLAEDVSYKLRQTISTIALHSEMMKKSCVDGWDVNKVLTLSDTSPVVGASAALYAPVGDEKICCEIESLINVAEYAMTTQSYVYSTLPTVSVEWITDDKNLTNNNNISASLQVYFTKIARAILSLKKNIRQVAVDDLARNTRIGPIIPNLFNLVVLVLNDDNLNALNVPTKRPLQSNVLDMVDALCSNPCSLDTNIQQQFQRLFPVMVSNILGNGVLAEKMVALLTKITRTWPQFITVGKGILFDYLSQGTKERLSPPMMRCLTALGRCAIVECLGDSLDYIDDYIHTSRRGNASELRQTILDASTCLLRSEPTTFLEDYVMTDYSMYEILGDSVLPRRTLFPVQGKPPSDTNVSEKTSEDDFGYSSLRPVLRRPKVRLISHRKTNTSIHRDAVFEPTKFTLKKKPITLRIKNCRNRDICKRNHDRTICSVHTSRINGVIVASGLLNRFRYRISNTNDFPIFGALIL
uniref:Transcription initiation factor TFIID subunit 6 n=3 Tax=Pararge aegeria TaxID=116150 RepID=S4PAG9_9NEOP